MPELPNLPDFSALSELPDLLSQQSIATVILASILLLLAILLFTKPVRLLLKLVLNTIGGFVALFFLNYFGQFIGVTLGFNLFNAVIVGIFGLPGVGLLLLLQWLL
ncbi:MAG: pro-sigmaK processing inhibitor BofA family protein [Oscillospiraceae bacterium]|nr:pro-sigmaK processing inhibitor BofA family protein [Oscillospiraceae bacterium]